jgi:hypothetical protein
MSLIMTGGICRNRVSGYPVACAGRRRCPKTFLFFQASRRLRLVVAAALLYFWEAVSLCIADTSYFLKIIKAAAPPPHGNVINHMGKLTSPHGNVINRMGKLTSPHGNVINRMGKLTSPHGNVMNRMGKLTSPHGNVINRMGKLTSPRGNIINRMGKLTSPRGNVVNPVENTLLFANNGKNQDEICHSGQLRANK